MKSYSTTVRDLKRMKNYVLVGSNLFNMKRTYPVDYGSGPLSLQVPSKHFSQMISLKENMMSDKYPADPLIAGQISSLESRLNRTEFL